MTQPELVIFDCDGVLVDSEIIASRVEAELLTAAGFEISAEELSETYAGLTFKDIMLRIEEKSKIPFQASLIDQAEVLVDRRLASDVRAIEGAHEAAAAVTAKRCICSNSRTERIEIRTIHYQHVCHQFATVRRNIPAKGPHCGRTKRLCTTPNVGEKTHRVWEFGSEINACSGDFPPSMMAATCPPNADALTGKR